MLVGYKLIKIDDGSVLERWGGTWGQCPGIPDILFLPDLIQILGPELNVDYRGYRLITWEMADPNFYQYDTVLPINHYDLVSIWTDKINQLAYQLLLPSDWMVVRLLEVGTEIPVQWRNYRTAVRETAQQSIASFAVTTDIDQFIALTKSISWPSQPA